MKYLLLLLLPALIIKNSNAQPNVCVNPPVGFQKGGDFDITIQRNGAEVVDDYLCIPEKVAVEKIGVINKSSFSNSSIRYIFGVDNATTIPANIILAQSRTVDGQSAGEFWIMQVGEEGGQKKLNCKKIQIDVSDRPTVEYSSCNNQTIALKVGTSNPVNYYSINWGDNTAIEKVNFQNTPLIVSHTYKASPNTIIEVVATYENTNLNRTCNSIPIKITPPSAFYIHSLETQLIGNQVNAILNIKKPNNERIDIQVSNDGGIIYRDYASTTANTYLVGNLTNKAACFKLKYKNTAACSYESPPICSISPEVDNTQYGQIDLKWNSTGKETLYDVYRTGGSLSVQNGLTKTNFSDKNLECGGNYLYQIVANYKDNLGNDVKVLSFRLNSNANFNQNSPPKQALVVKILDDGRPELNILDTTGMLTYIIYRSVNEQNFTKIGETTQGKFTDTGNANLNKYCYYVAYIDACNTISPNSATSCSIFLEGNAEQLTWNKPSDNAQTQISYQIIEVPDDNIIATQNNETFTQLNPQKQQQKYQIVATVTLTIAGKTYSTKSFSNIVEIDFTKKIYFPNTFTPNSDGINDTFEIKGDIASIEDFEMSVYNQWGELVFESKDITNTWDGTTQGTKVNEGVYVLKIYFKDKYGIVYNKKDKIIILN